MVKKAASMQIRFVGGIAVYSNNEIGTLLENSFNTNADFYAVIKRIATKFGHLPRYVYAKEAKKHLGKAYRTKALDENVIDNELSALLQAPNDTQGQDQFFELIASQYLLTGECFIWKNRGGFDKGKPLELFVLPSANIEVVPERDNVFKIASYVFRAGTGQIAIPKEDIIHWKTPNPNFDISSGTHLRGFSPLLPQKKIIQQSNDVTDASTAMFQNGGAKGVLFNETLDNIDAAQKTKIEGVIDRKLNNNEMKAAVATVQGKWGYLNLGLNSVDMELLDADEKLVKKICNANGLPFELFQSDTTFANKEQAWLFFITNTLMPMAASFDGELNRSLLPDFGMKGAFIATDFAELPEMQKMRLATAQAVSTMDYITRNEKRMIAGFEPRPEKEMDQIFITGNQMNIEESGIDETDDYEEDN